MHEHKAPPPLVATAAILSFLPIPLALVRVLLIQGVSLTSTRAIAWAVAIAFFGWISWSLYRGKKWSWWWVVISTLLGTVMMFISPQYPAGGSELVIYWLQGACIGLACLILLLPPNRKWFAA